jgi:TRAP-type C4-dicarboxylate transport system permease small subunit
MKILRGFLAVVCLVLGVIALALWGGSEVVVRTVEDGSVVTGIAQKVVEQPAVQSAITRKTQAYVTASLSNAGVDVASFGLQGTLDDAVAAAVASPAFQASLTGAIDGARADFAEQLTSPDFAGAPLVVNLDVSAVINQTIASIPVVGSLVPALTLEPLPVEVAGADEFGKVRDGYAVIHFLATWVGWIALLLLVAGIALMPRKRWLIPLGLLFAGLGAGALWVAVRLLTVDRIAGRLPGGRDGDLGGALERFAHQESLDRFSHRIFVLAAACLVGALVSFVIVKIASRPAKRRAPATGAVATEASATGPVATEASATEAVATGADHPHGQHEDHTPGHAR